MKRLVALLTSLRRSVPLSLRVQLTAWYTVAFALLLLLTGAVFYQYLERSLEASVDTDLQLRAQQIVGSLIFQHGAVTLDGVAATLPGFGSTSQAQASPLADVNQGTLMRLLDVHSRLLAETLAFQTLRVPDASVTQPLGGHALARNRSFDQQSGSLSLQSYPDHL